MTFYKKPELLAPAGNMEKLKTAFHFGADAVYLGLKNFSLRNFAGNFDLEQLTEAVQLANSLNKKVYVTLNLLPFDSDLEELTKITKQLEQIKPHGIIAADPGVFLICKDNCPSIEVHISTQTNVMNTKTANFWFKNGVKRIVIARELSIKQIRKMIEHANGEIEVFAHGALCISYSGRCFLSLYMTGRDANRGECTQSCRWKYNVLEEQERKGQYFPTEEDERGTYIFNSKDLCSIPVLDKLIDANVSSLKIEGRMKSVHYVGITVDVYRHAIDLISAGKIKEFRKQIPMLVDELSKVSNRGFTTNFFEQTPDIKSYNMESSDYINHKSLIGIVTDKGNDFIEIKLKNPLRKGDEIEIRDKNLLKERVMIKNIYSNDWNLMDFGRPNSIIRLKGSFKGGKNAIVRK
jgi:putative protease